jgi:outer membrane protein assembly factor BamB
MLLPLDGPSLQDSGSVDTITPVEVRVGGSTLTERKVVTIQPKNGKLYYYFVDSTGATPSAATLIADGLLIFKNQIMTFEVSEQQKIFVLAVSGTVNFIMVERA